MGLLAKHINPAGTRILGSRSSERRTRHPVPSMLSLSSKWPSTVSTSNPQSRAQVIASSPNDDVTVANHTPWGLGSKRYPLREDIVKESISAAGNSQTAAWRNLVGQLVSSVPQMLDIDVSQCCDTLGMGQCRRRRANVDQVRYCKRVLWATTKLPVESVDDIAELRLVAMVPEERDDDADIRIVLITMSLMCPQPMQVFWECKLLGDARRPLPGAHIDISASLSALSTNKEMAIWMQSQGGNLTLVDIKYRFISLLRLEVDAITDVTELIYQKADGREFESELAFISRVTAERQKTKQNRNRGFNRRIRRERPRAAKLEPRHTSVNVKHNKSVARCICVLLCFGL